MKVNGLKVFALCAAIGLSGPAAAQQVIDQYTAVIGPEDRLNSRGIPLTKAAQILAQDRANFHRFGIRHAGDMGDAYFGSRENRAALPQLLDRGNLAADVENAILRGMNARISVEVLGQTGRPRALRVTVVDDAQTAAQERMTEQTDQAASGVIIGSLPTMGRGPAVWQFVQDDYSWRGTAQIGDETGFDVALSCTKPGADPAQYPGGGHIRPHEAGVYTFYVSALAIGADYGAPGAGTFMLELSIDEQAMGAAPVIILATEMKLATNIPVAHPFIEGLRTGATLKVVDQTSRAMLTVPLSGAANALDTLAAFCATPLQIPTATPTLPSVSSAAETAHTSAAQETRSDPVTRSPSVADGGATAAPGAGLACEVTRQNRVQSSIRCTNADGSALESGKYRIARAQLGLRALGCAVPVITGAMSDSRDAVACFTAMFGLEIGTLTAAQHFDLLQIAGYNQKEDAIAKLVRQRGYVLASDQTPRVVGNFLPLDTTRIEPVALYLPDADTPDYYKRSGYFRSDLLVPLTKKEILDFGAPIGKTRHVNLMGQVDRWLRLNSRFVTPLLYDALLQNGFGGQDEIARTWSAESMCATNPPYCDPEHQNADLFPEAIQTALGQSPSIHVCTYDRRAGPATPLNPQLNGVPGLQITLGFWAQPIAEILASARLRSFDGSATGLHPLISIGPVAEACPQTLGDALQLIAGQFPELVPLAKRQAPTVPPASADPATGAATASSLDDPRQQQLRDLLGMSIAETNVDIYDNTADMTFLIVDLISDGGPAYRAGFRSGDYLWAIGWSEAGDVATFIREFERRLDNGAIVLTQSIPGVQPTRATRLIPFAQNAQTGFRKLGRAPQTDAARPGWTTLAQDEYGSSFRVSGEPWCAETVRAEFAQPLDANQLVDTKAIAFRNGYEAILNQCTTVQTALVTAMSSTLDAPVHIIEIDYTSQPLSFQRLGIDGLPAGASVSETRQIAAETAPLCDRLAAHPADDNRRYGLEGVEFILPDMLEPAINACLTSIEQTPDDPVTNFQLGRALYEAGLAQDAVAFLEGAAASGHGGAFDYLGQIYYDGIGVAQDYALGDSYFDQAMQAGFDPFSEPETAAFDTTGTAIASWFLEYNYDMSIKLMPQYANRTDINIGSEYGPIALRAIFHVAKEIGESCMDQGTIDRLISELEKEGGDRDALEHAIFMYQNQMPRMIPLMAQAVGVSPSDFSAPAGETAITLTSRYECKSVQLRQFLLNAVELIAR